VDSSRRVWSQPDRSHIAHSSTLGERSKTFGTWLRSRLVKTPVAEIPDPDVILSLARHLERKKNYSIAAYVDTRAISETSKHSIDNHNLKFHVPSPNNKKLASSHGCERIII
jgi:hypothetical protein